MSDVDSRRASPILSRIVGDDLSYPRVSFLYAIEVLLKLEDADTVLT